MAGKTPISRLQELSSKLKLSAPEYELIFNRPEGLDPKFTYKCTFDGHVCKFHSVCAFYIFYSVQLIFQLKDQVAQSAMQNMSLPASC